MKISCGVWDRQIDCRRRRDQLVEAAGLHRAGAVDLIRATMTSEPRIDRSFDSLLS